MAIGMHIHAFRRTLDPMLMFITLPLAGQRDTIRADVNLVVLPVSVRESNGKLVSNLRREDFRVREDGRVQEILSASIDSMPLSVAVMIDTGMGDFMYSRLAESIRSLGSALMDVDEAAIYGFDQNINKFSDFTSSHAELEKGLSLIKKTAESPSSACKGRNMSDALFTSALDLETRPAWRRKVVVVLSDGVVGECIHSLQKAREQLVQNQIQTMQS